MTPAEKRLRRMLGDGKRYRSMRLRDVEQRNWPAHPCFDYASAVELEQFKRLYPEKGDTQ